MVRGPLSHPHARLALLACLLLSAATPVVAADDAIHACILIEQSSLRVTAEVNLAELDRVQVSARRLPDGEATLVIDVGPLNGSVERFPLDLPFPVPESPAGTEVTIHAMATSGSTVTSGPFIYRDGRVEGNPPSCPILGVDDLVREVEGEWEAPRGTTWSGRLSVTWSHPADLEVVAFAIESGSGLYPEYGERARVDGSATSERLAVDVGRHAVRIVAITADGSLVPSRGAVLTHRPTPPVASFILEAWDRPGGGVIVMEDTPFTANATATHDPDDDALEYHWDWGDGTGLTDGPVVEHVYEEPGNYVVRLTVVDAAGLENRARGETVWVWQAAEPVTVASWLTGLAREIIAFSLSLVVILWIAGKIHSAGDRSRR